MSATRAIFMGKTEVEDLKLRTRKCYYELSDDINHTNMHLEFTEKNGQKKCYVTRRLAEQIRHFQGSISGIRARTPHLRNSIINHQRQILSLIQCVIYHYDCHSCVCMCLNVTHHPETHYLSLKDVLGL